jgi:hypothetical protein
MEYLSAKQAKETALGKQKVNIDGELQTIFSAIERASNFGKFSISTDTDLHEETKKLLKQKGYCVRACSQYNETSYVISWDVLSKSTAN